MCLSQESTVDCPIITEVRYRQPQSLYTTDHSKVCAPIIDLLYISISERDNCIKAIITNSLYQLHQDSIYTLIISINSLIGPIIIKAKPVFERPK